MDEFSQCNALKDAVRAKLTRQPSKKNMADVEKIKKSVRDELQEEFRKKLETLTSN